MHTTLRIPLFAVALLAAPVLCTAQIFISGQVAHAPESATVELFHFNNSIEWEKVTVASDTLGPDGHFQLTIPWDQPHEAQLRVADEYTDVFLMPGDSLLLTADYTSYDSTLHYAGRGAAVNNFLADDIRAEFADMADPYMSWDDAHAFAAQIDSLEKALNEFWERHQPERFPEAFRQHFAPTLRYRFTYTRWRYTLGYNSETNEFYKKEVPDDYFDFLRKMDLDDREARDHPDYRSALDLYFSEVEDPQLAKPDTTLPWKEQQAIRLRAQYQVRRSILQGRVRDHYLTYFLHDRFRQVTGNPGLVRELHADFNTTCSDPGLRAIIDRVAQQVNLLGQGRPAPAFTLADPDGKEVSLAGLEGKVVFIDFWATWCGPCLVAMPRTHELQEKFTGRDDVAFVYANVHDDHGRWMAHLEKNDMPGINLFADKEKSNTILKEYNFNGIPHYVLIDRAGNILDANADNGDRTEQLIRATLGE